MANAYKGMMQNEVIRELVVEQNELQDIVIELLKVVGETHPELTLRFIDYEKKIKKGRG